MALLTLLSCLLLTAVSSTEEDTPSVMRTRPVLLMPGFAASQLQSWSSHQCKTGFHNTLHRDIKVGDRLWLDVARVLGQQECWIECMKLNITTQDDVECKLR